MVVSRGRSPTIPPPRIGVHNRKATPPPPPAAAPQPAADFIPYIRTDEVLNQEPVDAADGPPALRRSGRTHPPPDAQFSSQLRAKTSSVYGNVSSEASPLVPAAPPAAHNGERAPFPDLPPNSRQQEILRGLAQLRQVSKDKKEKS